MDRKNMWLGRENGEGDWTTEVVPTEEVNIKGQGLFVFVFFRKQIWFSLMP